MSGSTKVFVAEVFSMTTRTGVDADAVVDFDHHSDEFNLNELAVNADLRRRCPVAWNENYGGFWFVTSYEAVAQIARDCDTFAHKYDPDAADGVNYQGELGVPRPTGQPALGIGEVDGPYHRALRRAVAPFFSPEAIAKMRPFMEQSAHWFLDQHISDGRMDLVLDYASPVPAILTMKLMGLPYDNWELYAHLFHSVMAVPQASAEYAEVIAEVPAMIEGLLKFAAARRAEPREDLTSFLVAFEFEGQRLDDTQILNILWNLIGGGVDTTTSLTSLSLLRVATEPNLRQQLIDRPAMYRTATDEFLRYFSVNKQLSRTVTRDIAICGQQLRRNDRVIISWLGANHDEHEFERPGEILLDRSANRHVAFGLGPHRCIGSHLARVMFEVMVKAVLERIPDYQVDASGVRQYLGYPTMTGLAKLPVTFTPGAAAQDKSDAPWS
jgi:cytochrome P450